MTPRGGMLVCPKCGYSKPLTSKELLFMRKTTVFQRYESKKIMDAVALDLPPGAIYEATLVCPRCGHRGVYYWRKQRSSAESSDVIEKTFKCPSCGYTWSESE